MVVRCEQLKCSYGSGRAIRDLFSSVSFTVERGDAVAVMGPSGSGKSTLLRMLAGLQEPRAGAIYIAGRKLTTENSLELRKKHVGVVFQDYRLVPFLTVFENVALPVQLLRLSSVVPADITRLLDGFGLTHLRDQPCESLSGGEQQRVGIARALVGGPDVIIADEPTGALDPRSSREVAETLRALAEEHQTAVIVATHDAEVAAVMSRVLTFQEGSVSSNDS